MKYAVLAGHFLGGSSGRGERSATGLSFVGTTCRDTYDVDWTVVQVFVLAARILEAQIRLQKGKLSCENLQMDFV